MTNFAQLKKSNDNLSRLLSEVDKVNQPQQSNNSNNDDRFWRPELDKSGNGFAVIRFLPESEGEELPWVRVFNHGFQGPTGKWYIENSLTTLNQKDPVAEYNSILWNSGTEANKDIARKQKRRLSFISNIYVVKDPSNPENEGKVFLYKYGKKIFDKLNEAMNPQFEDEKPVNPFDLWEGADFKLKIRNVEGYRNYDKSELDVAGPLFEEDDELEQVWKSQYSLVEFVDPKNFKTFEELQSKLNRVLGLDGAQVNTTAEQFEEVSAPAMTEAAPAPIVGDADDDESLDFFKRLAEE